MKRIVLPWCIPGATGATSGFVSFKSIHAADKARAQLNQSAFLNAKRVVKAQFAKDTSNFAKARLGGAVKKEMRKADKTVVPTSTKLDEGELKLREEEFKKAGTLHHVHCDQLPKGVDKAELVDLFDSHPGYCGLRFVATRGVCFVSFETQALAEAAAEVVRGHRIRPDHPLSAKVAKV